MPLEISSVSKTFGGLRAVDDCSFRVESGSITGLIGPNGAGKSTLVGIISGFLACDSGSVSLDGNRLDNRPVHVVARSGVSRTFQQAQEWGGLTLIENLLLAAPYHRHLGLVAAFFSQGAAQRAEAAARVEARAILDEFGILEVRDQLAGTLSGGQKRLLEIGRVLMAHPRLVLLDEPVAGVNPVLFPIIADAVQALRKGGATVLLVEHNLEFVEATCDAAVVMASGRVIAQAPMRDLRHDAAVVDAYLGTEGAA